MTQKLAYNLITQLKELKPITRKGQENLKDTMDALEELGSLRPTEQKLWKDLKYSKIKNNIGDWFRKIIHNRLRAHSDPNTSRMIENHCRIQTPSIL